MTKRRRITHSGISARAICLFRYGLQLQREGKEDTDLFKHVDRELSHELHVILKPWHPSVFEVSAGFDDEEDAILATVKPEHRAYYRHTIKVRRDLLGAPLPRFGGDEGC
jgi:hypothetical protein